MWGSIVALYGRYPHALAYLKDGWWEDAAHVEVLCALVVWRDWIDHVAEDPRGTSWPFMRSSNARERDSPKLQQLLADLRSGATGGGGCRQGFEQGSR